MKFYFKYHTWTHPLETQQSIRLPNSFLRFPSLIPNLSHKVWYHSFSWILFEWNWYSYKMFVDIRHLHRTLSNVSWQMDRRSRKWILTDRYVYLFRSIRPFTNLSDPVNDFIYLISHYVSINVYHDISLSLSLYIYIYIYIGTWWWWYIYIYIYIYVCVCV